ncbi:MAG TPA: 1-deoxy-D-xylulose-5-phosphate reductoisomerase [Verrucomicrobiae bacterium]|nr:1-deoxy-D-xylulose-5-phosphate reductoisomerase [Verrucomicrobiae bacterium]
MSALLEKLQSIEKGKARAAAKAARSQAMKYAESRELAPKTRRWPKNIAIMGSTGSVGVNTLKIVRTHPEKFKVRVLAAKKNDEILVEQALECRPEMVCLFDPAAAARAEQKLKRHRIRVVSGIDGLTEASTLAGVDEVIFAMVGAVGLIPIFSALRARKEIAIANKEPLVMAGSLLVREARSLGVPVFPIDSEHSGLWQCLEGHARRGIKKLVLTSSGGPFRARKGSLAGVTPAEALRHPKWKMGPKITIDSATLMNKGLEVIEAANLFEMDAGKVEVLIHPEAIVHALVEFVDGSHLAHLGITDMRLPIQYALSYPERLENHLPELDLAQLGTFHFEKPDRKRFPCLDLGYRASAAGGSMPAVLNAANEVAVEAFLNFKIGFLDIAKTIEKVMNRHTVIKNPDLSGLLQADDWARETAKGLL